MFVIVDVYICNNAVKLMYICNNVEKLMYICSNVLML